MSDAEKQFRDTLRAKLRQQRRSLSQEQQHRSEKLASAILVDSTIFIRSQHIAVYWPDDGEMGTQPIIQAAWSQNKQVYLPAIGKSNHMDFVPFQPDDRLSASAFGIFSPAETRQAINPTSLNLVIAPLVAFDQQGNRLGRGGGFYDRYMQRCRQGGTETKSQNIPIFLGLTHSFQQVDALPSAQWDIPLDAAVTEDQLILFNH